MRFSCVLVDRSRAWKLWPRYDDPQRVASDFAPHAGRESVIVLSDHGKKTFMDRGFPDHKLRIVPHGILHSPRRLHEIEDEKVSARSITFTPHRYNGLACTDARA